MKKFTIYIFLLNIITIFTCIACGSKKDEQIQQDKCHRTILVYMIATNNLGSNGFDRLDIDEMKKAISSYTDGDCRLLIYYTGYKAQPSLIEIKNIGNQATEQTIKEYASTLHASVTKSRFSEVINDIKTYAPAEEYGLVLWSHSDGWARSLKSLNTSIRDFGLDNGAKMPIDSLADAIPNGTFHFIYADVCYMGSIEVAYQLRNKTKYYIGSPTETPGYGMAYDRAIPLFFEQECNLLKVCQEMYKYYSSEAEKAYRSLTISLIDCSQLQNLATVCHNIHASAKRINDISNLQHYNQTAPYFYFDFKQYMDSISSTEILSKEFNNALSDVIIYKASTPTITFGSILYIDNNKFSGLSSFIMGTGSNENEEYYKTLDWYNDVIKQQ